MVDLVAMVSTKPMDMTDSILRAMREPPEVAWVGRAVYADFEERLQGPPGYRRYFWRETEIILSEAGNGAVVAD